MDAGGMALPLPLIFISSAPLVFSSLFRSMWGYWSTDGLGLFEYLLLAEALGAEPIWVINNGGRLAHECMPACLHARRATAAVRVPMPVPLPHTLNCRHCPQRAGAYGQRLALGAGERRRGRGRLQLRQLETAQTCSPTPATPAAPAAQEALDGVEFISGPPDSRWGAVRAAMGRREVRPGLRGKPGGSTPWRTLCCDPRPPPSVPPRLLTLLPPHPSTSAALGPQLRGHRQRGLRPALGQARPGVQALPRQGTRGWPVWGLGWAAALRACCCAPPAAHTHTPATLARCPSSARLFRARNRRPTACFMEP